MNQSNKKNLEFIVNSGVNYFLQDSPRNWFENEKKSELPDPNINAGAVSYTHLTLPTNREV